MQLIQGFLWHFLTQFCRTTQNIVFDKVKSAMNCIACKRAYRRSSKKNYTSKTLEKNNAEFGTWTADRPFLPEESS